jgi:hypothetical protein
MAQAEENSGNWIWWTLGGVALLGLGVGSYFFFSKKGDKSKNKSNDGDNKPTTTPVVQKEVVYRDRPVTTTSTTESPAKADEKQTNFNNKEQGNAFRRWVRAKDFNYAKEIDLSATGPFDNSTIRKAYAKYGDAFQQINTNVLDDRFGSATLQGWQKTDDQFGPVEKYYESGDANNGARITFDRNGRIYIQGRKNGTWGSKWKAGGWYLQGNNSDSSPILIFINGKEYKPYSNNLAEMNKDLVWAIWKDGGLWSGSAFTAFSDYFTGSGNDMDIFSANGGEIILGGGSTASVQDSLL